MSEEIHLTPEELERISKAVGNFGSKIQALVDIAKIPEGIIAFFESPVWGNVQKIITDAYNVNEKLLNGYDNSVLQANFEKIGQSLVLLPDSRLMTQIDKLLTPDYTNIVKVTPHVCRHTFCSRMAAARMNPKTLQYIMGHSDIGVTLNVYTHLGFDVRRHIVGGANCTLFSVNFPPRLCRTGTCRRLQTE